MHESFYPLSTTYQIHLNRNKSALYNITILERISSRIERAGPVWLNELGSWIT
jgi:hypothetical protein